MELLSVASTTERNASCSELQLYPPFHTRGHAIEMKRWHSEMLTSWPAHLSFPPSIFWTGQPTREVSNGYRERASGDSLQVRRIRMSLRARPQEYIRNRLQLSWIWYILRERFILEGLFRTTASKLRFLPKFRSLCL